MTEDINHNSTVGFQYTSDIKVKARRKTLRRTVDKIHYLYPKAEL